MRILIVEDEERLARIYAEELKKVGYYADIAFTVEDAIDKFTINEYDLVLLDINLPDMLGFEFLREIRNNFKSNVGVIIISARNELDDRSGGIEMGADDYLVKPVALRELKARVNAVMRRLNHQSSAVIEIAELVIDTHTLKVMINGQEIKLLKKEFDILKYLAFNHPRVISSEELIEHVYDETFDPFSSVLRVHISKLKRHLREVNSEEDVIETVRGVGYRICLEE